MKHLLAVAVGLLLLTIAAPAPAAPGGKVVHVYVVDPTNEVSTVTADQAVSAVQTWMGSPSDAPCVGSPSCSMQGWFKHELGKTINWDVVVVPAGELGGTSDACGAAGSYFNAISPVLNAGGGFGTNDRTMIVMLGAGGWAGHFAPSDRGKGIYHMGMVGDWGVMEQFNSEVSCIPEWDYPARGFSHEFVGQLGMYTGGGCYQDGQGCFVGDPMSAVEKSALLRYSGQWFRDA